MKTFLCILAVASVANATLELPSIFGGGSSGGSPRGISSGSARGSSGGSSGGKDNLGEVLGSSLKGLSSLLSGGGPRIQLDHNVNVVHEYPTSQGGDGGAGYGQVIEGTGGGGYHADQQEVRVIRVIHEDAAPAYHGYGHGSEGNVQIIKVLHQQAPEQTGWGW